MDTDRTRIEVKHVSWHEHRDTLTGIRRVVFVDEQLVPIELELDGIDSQCEHVLAVVDRVEAVGTGRLLPDGHIGRMAVLRAWRRSGIGTAMLRALIDLARLRGHRYAVLNAQCYVVELYRREGFSVSSEEFLEAGIPHVRMRKRLRDDTGR